MISPRRTQLLRVPDLRFFRRTILARLADDPIARADTMVIVPTHGAARQLQAAIDRHQPPGSSATGGPVPARPIVVTRDQCYDVLHSRLAVPAPCLGAVERDSIAQAAAVAAAQSVPSLAFRVRPGLVVEILRFYDQLRRQAQTVRRFEELMTAALAPGVAAEDRGALRVRDQTRFIAQTFREYEARVEALGVDDEHRLRERLLREPLARPVTRVIVTVADWIADPDGLFSADFDLLARMSGIDELDLVATAGVLASGFHERIHQYWPELDDLDAVSALGLDPTVARPCVCVPRGDSPPLFFTCRDREEEIVRVARQLTSRGIGGDRLDGHAVVVRRPLPYLYLAADVFGAARLPFQSPDALPLAAEPVAAAVDLVLDCVENEVARGPFVALLGSPHFALGEDGTAPSRESLAALSRLLSEARFLGGADVLAALVLNSAGNAKWDPARPACAAALSTVRRIAPLAKATIASQRVEALSAFLRDAFRPLASVDDAFRAREGRARDAVFDVLARLARSLAAHHDPVWTPSDLGAAVRRWVEHQTFMPAPSASGVHLLDDQAARYGEFDEVTLVGLVESEWPEKPRRNIFYPPSLLKALGWPTEKDRRGAATARFLDLVTLPAERVTLSTFLLEDESIVGRSVLLDEVPRAGLLAQPEIPSDAAPVLFDDQLASGTVPVDGVPAPAREWARERLGRTDPAEPRFHGAVGAHPPRAWSVSALETYVRCPFKFYAQYVLGLEEDPDDEEAIDPRRQGIILHAAFETFYREWTARGHGAVTPANLVDARALWETVVERTLAHLPEADAGLERTRLVGSSVAIGLGEVALRMEAERAIPVVQRLLEVDLHGPLTVSVNGVDRVVELRGKADRIDVLADGTFRLIDYKTGYAPKPKESLQLAVYALRAEQRFRAEGTPHMVSEAAYLAFKGPRRVVPLFDKPEDRQEKLDEAQARLIDVISAIERGEFPPRPQDVFWCERCAFGSVCRRDYVGDV